MSQPYFPPGKGRAALIMSRQVSPDEGFGFLLKISSLFCTERDEM